MRAGVPNQKPNIVVVGGSYVGMKVTQLLSSTLYQTHRVVLVEKNSHFQHLFAFPRFSVVRGYEYLAFVPYTNAFSSCPPHSVRQVHGLATFIFPDKVLVKGPDGSEEGLDYEYLVVATGSKIPHVAGKPKGIAYFQLSQRMGMEAERVVIIGGGAFGVHMLLPILVPRIGLKSLICLIECAADIRDVYPTKSVTLIHSWDQLMPSFHPALHSIIMSRFEELGIETIMGDRVKLPDERFPIGQGEFDIELVSGRKVKADLALTATGQTPSSDLMRTLSPQAISPSTGRVLVYPTLQIADDMYPRVFALGDVAETGGPKQARPGYRQAEVVVENVRRLVAARTAGRETVPKEELEVYHPDPAAIHLTLGLRRSVIFHNPFDPTDEPFYELKDDGAEDMNVKRVWEMYAHGTKDYYA